MKYTTILFFSLLIVTTIGMQYAFFWFTEHETTDYPLGKVPDAYFHYTQVILHDMATGMKYIGTHLIFWALISIFPPMATFNIVLPIMFSLLLPLGVFAMTREYTEDTNIAILASLMFTYGTDVITTIYQISVWPQGWNMVLTSFAIACGIRYIRNKKKRWLLLTIVLLAWSALAHMQFAMASAAIGVIFLMANRRYMETFLLTIILVFLMFNFRDFYTMKIINDTFYVNPQMLLFTIFPPNMLLAIYGLWLARKYEDHWKNLLLVGPALASCFFLFIDPNFRLYMNMFMFLSPFMAIGLIKTVSQIASIINPPFKNYIRHIWIKRGLFTMYLMSMFIFFMLFHVYLSYVAIMTQPHGTDKIAEQNEKYYPPPTMIELLKTKRIEDAHLKVNEFCIECLNSCKNATV